MSLSKNAKSRIVTVTAPLFLGFVMPWFLQANRDIRGEAQFKFDPSAMFASTVAEVLAALCLSWCSLFRFFTLRSNQTLGSCFCLQVSSL